jgi:ribosomal protein S12 methylthiotransferase
MKTYYIESLGCAKNQVDSEHIMAELEAEHYVRVEDAADAALIVVNTCAFIESAKRESINTIFSFRQLYPDTKISVRGCLAERYHKELLEFLPEADELCGVPALGDSEGGEQGNQRNTHSGKRPLLSLPGSAYVKISEGCNNRCSFCAIPLIRGGLKSRSVASITGECRELLKRGVKELALIAQDAGSYGNDGANSGGSERDGQSSAGLPALLRAIGSIRGDGIDTGFWVRLLYLHPDRLLPEKDGAHGLSSGLMENLIQIMRDDPRILPYFDLPFQHASASVLRAMGRKGNRHAYLRVIGHLRESLPRAVIRSTFLVGFPGETDEDFAELLDFQHEAQIDWLGVFAYSREEGTAAYTMKHRVSKKTAAARKAALEEAQIPITAARLTAFSGIETEALIEEVVDRGGVIHDGGIYDGGIYAGKEKGNVCLSIGRLPIHAPEVDGAAVIESAHPLIPGSMVPVRTVSVSGVDMRCRA